MRLSFKYPFLFISSENAEEHPLIRSHSYVMETGPGEFFCYWTYLPQIYKAFPHAVADQSMEDMRIWTAFRSDLRHLAPDWDRSVIRRYFFDTFQPRDYQCDGIYSLLRIKRAILADATGLGKTIQSAGAVVLDSFARPHDQRPVLIVCPSGLRYQWREELGKMFKYPDSDEAIIPAPHVLVLDGSPAQRRTHYNRDPLAWNAISYELLLRDYDRVVSWLKSVGGARAVIIDESSRLKDPGTKSFQRVDELVKELNPELVFLLNATPIENGLDDLWTQMRIVCPYIFPHYSDYRRRYVRTIRFEFCRSCSRYRPASKIADHRATCNGGLSGRYRPPFEKVIGYRDIDEASSLIRDRFVRRDYSDVPEQLPELIVCRHTVDMTAKQRRAYETVKNDVSLDPRTKLTELVRRALFFMEGKKIESAKMDALKSILSEIGDDKVVCATESKVFCLGAARELKKAGYEVLTITGDDSAEAKSNKQREFTSGKAQILIGTSAIERGLNLQVASWFINLDLPWNPAKWLQRVGRVRRIGARAQQIRVVNIVAQGSVEISILQAIYAKLDLFNKLFDGDIDSLEMGGQINFAQLIDAEVQQ